MSFDKDLRAILQKKCGVKDCPDHVLEPAEAIKQLITQEVEEAYKKGYIDAGIQALQGGKE